MGRGGRGHRQHLLRAATPRNPGYEVSTAPLTDEDTC